MNGRFDPESLIVFLVILSFSILPTVRTLFASSIKIDRTSRLLSQRTQLIFFPIRSTSISFSDLANIEVQSYRASNRRFSSEAYRVNSIDRAGNRIALNWDGKRDEMFNQAQKIAAMTGAPLIDNTAQSINVAEQVIEQVRKLGLPLPQEMMSTAESSSPNAPDASVEETTQSEASLEPEAGPAGASARQDLRNLALGELEKRMANDPADSDARYALASKYHARGQLDQAIEMYQATLQADTTNAEAQNDLGVALQQRGTRTEAEAAYRRSIALDPFSFRAHLNLALLLRMMNRAAEASQEFFQARQNARGNNETQLAEAASTGARLDPQLSNK